VVEPALIALIAEQLRLPPEEHLDGATPLVQGGLALDSIRLLELCDAVERRFGVELDEDDLASLTTIGALAARLEAKLAP